MRFQYPNIIVFLLLLFSISIIFSISWATSPAKPIPLYPRINNSFAQTPQNPDTIKILGIRVEFQLDNLETTTGNGTFGSGIPDSTQIDPLPHNRRYFQDQLLFLKNFYETQSNGKIILDTTNALYPFADDSSYQLPHPMWHYNHNDDDYLDYGLATLFRDAWQAADTQNNDIDFSLYPPDSTCFIVFHAGVGKDFAFDFDPTPFDIPSAYIELEDLENLAPEGVMPDSGISVDNGQYFVPRGIILPETENQEGYELGMHGHMALLFGHHLGMPNLYNSQTGASVTGWFELMDQGSGKIDGLVPAPPSAWCKIHMGWAVLITINTFPDTVSIPLGAIYKVPITNKEYFLIENINSFVRAGVSWDSLQYAYYVQTGNYPVTYDLLKDSVSQVTFDPESGVLTNIGNWGIGRPASGILIWHIDENVIDTALSNNNININPNHLGVYLEEADGAFDIGNEYGWFSPGRGTELGSPYDAFFEGNEVNLDANPGNTVVVFGNNTFPDTKSNTGTYSHLIFHSFSAISDTMSFIVNNNLLRPGFPKILSDSTKYLFSANIDGIPGEELMANAGNKIYAWSADGSEVPVKENGNLVSYLYQFEEYKTAGTCVAADYDGDDADEIAIIPEIDFFGGSDVNLYLIDYSPADSTINVYFTNILNTYTNNLPYVIATTDSLLYSAHEDTLFCWRFPNSIPQLCWKNHIADCSLIKPFHPCLFPNGDIILTQSNGRVYRYDIAGNLLWSTFIPAIIPINSPVQVEHLNSFSEPVAGDIDRDGIMELVVFGSTIYVDSYIESNQQLIVIDTDNGFLEPGFPVEEPIYSMGKPSLADIDQDGFLEIIATTQNEGLMIFEYNGILSDYFPYQKSDLYGSVLIGENSVNSSNLFFSNIDGIYAVNNQAELISGFPLSIDSSNSSVLYSFDGHNDALASISECTVYAWDTDISEIIWGSKYKDHQNSNLVATLFTPIPPTGALMPDNLCYNWPNPNNPGENFTYIRYYLNYPADIKITIYDLAGDKVDELHDSGIGQAYNETTWDLTNIASGVYFSRVEANGGGQKAVKFIKIAVIK